MNAPRSCMPRRRTAPRHPGGFSLLELVVVIGILSLMLALLLPAVMQTRESARRLACNNHLRQLALGLLNNAETHGRLPASGCFSATKPERFHSWVTAILAEIDEGNLAQAYDLQKPYDDPANFAVTRTHIALLACPDDVSVVDGEGNLSYVVNGGFSWTIAVDCPAVLHVPDGAPTMSPLDLNGNGVVCAFNPADDDPSPDVSLLKRTSLFFVENWPPGTGTVRHHRLADITDGTTQTLLLTENVRAGYDPAAASSWGCPDPRYHSFFVSGYICDDGRCAAGHVHYERANDRQSEPQRSEALNAALALPEGLAPWPSALHSGMINAAYCDGHVQALSEQVDGGVYAALVTPQGSFLSGPLQQPVITGPVE